MMNTETFAFIGLIVNGIATLLLYSTVLEMRKGTYAQAFKAALDILQQEDVRNARKFLFRELEKKPYQDWSQEDRDKAEIVGYTYDALGMMIRHKMLLRQHIDSWDRSIRESWKILEPMAEDYREQKGFKERWEDYEKLATHSDEVLEEF